MITLRDYQLTCAAQSVAALAEHKSTLVVMATGLGKTTVAAHIAKYWPGRVYFIAHRRELIFQAHERLKEYTGREVEIEMGSYRASKFDVVVGSIQSLISRNLPAPDLIIIDEAHHAVSPMYRSYLDRNPQAKLLGVTATPDRADGLALGEVFESVAYRYETPRAIQDGWLAPVFKKKVNFANLLSTVGPRKTIIFTPTVKEAIAVADNLPNATFVHGELPSSVRDERLLKFKQGGYQFMTNCNILTEGFDSPDIECVCMMRAMESRGLFVQCIGRGLRTAPGKTDCLYLDLVDMPDHSLQGPKDVLAGKDSEKQRRQRAKTVKSIWRQYFV